MFVDSLLAVQSYQLEPHNMGDMLAAAEPTRAVNAAAALLSNLTQFAGVVLTPKRAQVFRQIRFIRLSDKRVLLIIVTPDGDVQNRILFVQRDYAEAELLEAGNFFNVHFAGKSFDAVRRTLSTELAQLREDISRLMQAAVEASAEAAEDGDAVVISGERKLLDVTDIASDMDRLRKMFSLFEKRPTCCSCSTCRAGRRGADLHRRRFPAGADGRGLGHHRALRRGRQGGRHARRDRPDPHGLRARHPDRGHHGAPAVQRPQPQPVVPPEPTSSWRRKGVFVFLRLFKYLWPERYLPEAEQEDPSTKIRRRGSKARSACCW